MINLITLLLENKLDAAIKVSLEKFIQSKERNTWISNRIFKLYVRNANRYLPDGAVYKSLDIASIDVEKKGQGVFTSILNIAESLCKIHHVDIIYVESILNPRLIPFLEKRGYVYIETNNSMYKKI